MRSLNRAQVIGYVGHDVEMRETKNGVAVVNLRIATDESYTNKEGEKVEQTEWHSTVFFGKLAEIVGEYVKKGTRILAEGPLRTRSWVDKEDVTRYTTEIRVDNMLMLGSKGGSATNSNGNRSSSKGNPKGNKSKRTASIGDDDGYARDEDLD
jgi:single-strand DNA-binding protein